MNERNERVRHGGRGQIGIPANSFETLNYSQETLRHFLRVLRTVFLRECLLLETRKKMSCVSIIDVLSRSDSPRQPNDL